MTEILITGIGNPFRGDDGAGWAVIDALAGKVKPNITLLKISGEISELMELFEKYPRIYLIDACQASAEPGTWQRFDACTDPIPDDPQTSTHGLSISQAVALAKAFNQLPALIIYTINGSQFAMSEGLSAPVAQAIAIVAQTVLNEIEHPKVSCTKKA